MGIEVVDARIATNHLKRILKLRGMAQEDAARRVGVSYRHFNRVALGHTNPTLLLASKISTVLDAPITEIFDVRVKFRKSREVA